MAHPHPPSPSSNPPNDVPSDALVQLSTHLISAGFLREPLPPDTLHGGSARGQKLLLKAVWSMIASRSKEMNIRESLMAKQREVLYEHTRLEGFLLRAEKEKLEAQQEATASTNRANAAQKDLEVEKGKHRKTRDDLNKLKNAERLIKTTSVHELRKKTNELSELQRRLTKLAAGKEPTASLLVLSGPITVGARVDTEPGGRVGLLEFDLQTSRESNTQLRTENSRLREYLGLYEQHLNDLITEIDNHNDDSDAAIMEEEEPVDMESRFFGASTSLAPLSTIYKRMSQVTYKVRDKALELSTALKESRAKMVELDKRIEVEQSKSQVEKEDLRKKFEDEIERLNRSLKEAETIIDGWAHSGLANGIPLGQMGDVSVEESLQIGRQSLEIQVEALMAERKKLAEEAVALGRQRAEQEMQKLDEERRKILEELDAELSPPINPPEPGPAQPIEEDKTLESLVVYTKPPTTAKKPVAVRAGKAKSSVSRAMAPTHAIKQKPPAPSVLSKPPARSRTAVLKSLLSITGDEGKVGDAVAGSSSQVPSRVSPRAKNKSSVRASTDAPANSLNQTKASVRAGTDAQASSLSRTKSTVRAAPDAQASTLNRNKLNPSAKNTWRLSKPNRPAPRKP